MSDELIQIILRYLADMADRGDYEAKKLLELKDEWYNLEFFEQSKWRTDYFNLPPEKFKQVIWE